MSSSAACSKTRTPRQLDRLRRQAERDRREGISPDRANREVETIDARRSGEMNGEETVVGDRESDGQNPITLDSPRQSPGQLERDLIRRRDQLQRDLEENRISPRYWETVSRYFDKSIERQRRLKDSESTDGAADSSDNGSPGSESQSGS
ncbi:MAG: hypothetical protein ACFHWZ_04630 [Phycisphaerales bacterium]